MILWELVTGEEPWASLNPMQVVGAVGFNRQRLELPPDITPEVKDLIHQCWAEAPSVRPLPACLPALNIGPGWLGMVRGAPTSCCRSVVLVPLVARPVPRAHARSCC